MIISVVGTHPQGRYAFKNPQHFDLPAQRGKQKSSGRPQGQAWALLLAARALHPLLRQRHRNNQLLYAHLEHLRQSEKTGDVDIRIPLGPVPDLAVGAFELRGQRLMGEML